MEPNEAHPDDETLFLLIEDELEESRAREVEAHLDSCATCGALVRAALAGSPDDTSPVEAMDAARAERMEVALASAWRQRVASIAAQEAEQDARSAAAGETVEQLAVQPLAPDAVAGADTTAVLDVPVGAATGRETARASRTPRWQRRAVPILAFVVLAALAGVSIQIGRDDGAIPRSDRGGSSSSSTPSSGDDAQGTSAAPDGATAPRLETQAGASAPQAGRVETPTAIPGGDVTAGAPADSAAGPGSGTGAAADLPPADDGSSAAPVPPVADPADDPTAAGEDLAPVCIATRDESSLILPDGRIPRQVVAGPLGTYIVCG